MWSGFRYVGLTKTTKKPHLVIIVVLSGELQHLVHLQENIYGRYFLKDSEFGDSLGEQEKQ
jgi:hypothetical protein